MPTNVWKGHLTFGLVTLPVTLQAAARAESVSFNHLHRHKDGSLSRLKQQMICGDATCECKDKAVPRDEIVKGLEYEKGRYVTFTEAELDAAAPDTSAAIEILEFVKAGEVDPVYFESSYYLAPDETGEKAYALLFKALKKAGMMGVAKVSMHRREHIILLRAGEHGLLLHTMFYSDEVRELSEFRTDVTCVNAKELSLALSLVNDLAASFDPKKFNDSYRINLGKLGEQKINGLTPEAKAATPSRAPVINIMDALERSLKKHPKAEAKEKPAAKKA